MNIYRNVNDLLRQREAVLADDRKVTAEGCVLYDDSALVQAISVSVYSWTGAEWTLMDNSLCLTRDGAEKFINNYRSCCYFNSRKKGR